MSISEEVRRAIEANPDGNAEEVARAVFARMTKQELFPVLLDYVATAQRNVVRGVEYQAFQSQYAAAMKAAPSVAEVAAARLEDFRSLYAQTIALGDGSRVTWGRATVQDHELRLAMLLRLRAGLDKTIERHREAIAILRETGASCLEEVNVAAA